MDIISYSKANEALNLIGELKELDTKDKQTIIKAINEVYDIANKGIPGRSIEYKWEDTSLGIRVQGDENYTYVDLIGDKGNTGKSLEFNWQGTELGIKQQGDEKFSYTDLKGEQGNQGKTGEGLEYDWKDTNLGVKKESDFEFSYVDLQGEKGNRGKTGDSIQYDWQNTKLGIKQESETDYNYVELQGEKGSKGNTGEGLDYEWDGTKLGVKKEKDEDFTYTELKGEKGVAGKIENLESSHVENALGYMPISNEDIPSSLPANGGNSDTVNGFTVKTDVPENAVFTDTQVDISSKADISYVDESISEIPKPDLSDYAKKSYVDTVISEIPDPDLSSYAKKTYVDTAIDNIPDTDLSDYAKISYVDSKVKTDVPENAKFTDTVYEHPNKHDASIITETIKKRFVSDNEKSKWNSKETTSGAQDKADKALAESKTYVNNKVKTNVPKNAKFTDTVVDISGKADKTELDDKADKTKLGDLSNLKTSSKTNIVEATNELFTDVSNGKNSIKTAITDKDNNITVPSSPSFSDLVKAISEISSGKLYQTGTLTGSTYEEELAPGFDISMSRMKATTDFMPSSIILFPIRDFVVTGNKGQVSFIIAGELFNRISTVDGIGQAVNIKSEKGGGGTSGVIAYDEDVGAMFKNGFDISFAVTSYEPEEEHIWIALQ